MCGYKGIRDSHFRPGNHGLTINVNDGRGKKSFKTVCKLVTRGDAIETRSLWFRCGSRLLLTFPKFRKKKTFSFLDVDADM